MKFHQSEDTRAVASSQYPERSFITASVRTELPDEHLRGLCGLEEFASTHPRNLPRALQKLLSVAITLRLSRGYGILDEPTAGMDLPTKLRFISLLNEFRELGIIIFTHDPALDELGLTLDWKELSAHT